jgi:hypothetical protein
VGKGLPRQAGERRAAVREGVDADAEPGDAVAAGDADQAEEQDDADLAALEVLEDAEVDADDGPMKTSQDDDELALLVSR